MKNKYQGALDYITPRLKDYRTVKEDNFELQYNNKVSNDYNAIQAIKELVRKEKPVKLLKSQIDGYRECGNCNSIIVSTNHVLPKYCSECGQKIDWGGGE